MHTKNWAAPSSWDTVCRRASGRRHWNAIRQARAFDRRMRLWAVVRDWRWPWPWGTQAQLAQRFGVAKSTICADVQQLLFTLTVCPACGHLADKETLQIRHQEKDEN